MQDPKFRAALEEYAKEQDQEIIMLDSPYFDKSVVGVTEDGRLVYDFDKMVKEYRKDERCSELDAIEFLEYNTLRAIPYMGEGAPIIVHINRKELLDRYGPMEEKIDA